MGTYFIVITFINKILSMLAFWDNIELFQWNYFISIPNSTNNNYEHGFLHKIIY